MAYQHPGLNDPRDQYYDRLSVQGRIPEWLIGTLIRSTPSLAAAPQGKFTFGHETSAKLHKFSFKGGKVSYVNRVLDTLPAAQSSLMTAQQFAADPAQQLFKHMLTMVQRMPSDALNSSLAKAMGQFSALTQKPMALELAPDILEQACAAPQQHERSKRGLAAPKDADHPYRLTVSIQAQSEYRLERARTPRNAFEAFASLDADLPSYVHSFSLTPKHIVLTLVPFIVDPRQPMLKNRPFIENYRWHPQLNAQFVALDRASGKVVGRWEADPFFTFHHVRAFERDGEIVVDLVGYADASVVEGVFYGADLQAALPLSHGRLRRYRLMQGAKRAVYDQIADVSVELPRTASSMRQRSGENRWVYGVSLRDEHTTGFYDQLVKIDTHSGRDRIWTCEGCFPGEPVLLQRPGARSEDDGVVLSVVWEAKSDRIFMLVLDASSFSELARAVLPQSADLDYRRALIDLELAAVIRL